MLVSKEQAEQISKMVENVLDDFDQKTEELLRRAYSRFCLLNGRFIYPPEQLKRDIREERPAPFYVEYYHKNDGGVPVKLLSRQIVDKGNGQFDLVIDSEFLPQDQAGMDKLTAQLKNQQESFRKKYLG